MVFDAQVSEEQAALVGEVAALFLTVFSMQRLELGLDLRVELAPKDATEER